MSGCPVCEGGGGLGASVLGGGRCRFLVWAPLVRRVRVRIGGGGREVDLEPCPHGYHAAVVQGVAPGTLYTYRLDGGPDLPDPASRYQPQGVHGPSAVVDTGRFPWTDSAWRGIALRDLVLYELHVGTFTATGTFDAALAHLDGLRELGVTAVEVMPVAQIPGARGWGYDVALPYAVQHSYGGPDGLARFVDACHAHGLAVLLDVVYNHLGPEGNHLGEYGPYFRSDWQTPWGPALNFDGPDSDEVRRFFVENACRWVAEFHVDGLRLDAVHAIVDRSARPLLREICEAVQATAGLSRRVHVIAESDLNDARLIRPVAAGGLGLDAQWSDDFHHALHTLLTGERDGYYADFGRVGDLARALRRGYVYTGQRSAFRRRRHGNEPVACAPQRFVVYAQNHDQVGNRLRGDRLGALLAPAGLRLAAAVTGLSPFVPLLFMGEEHGERAPFQFFADYGDPALIDAVRRSRLEEFAAFKWTGEVPDPQAPETFERCLLNRDGVPGLRNFYREVLRLRRDGLSLAAGDWAELEVVVFEAQRALQAVCGQVALVCSFNAAPLELRLPLPPGRWRKHLDAAEARWGGPGSDLADRLDSPGEVRLRLTPWGCLLLARES